MHATWPTRGWHLAPTVVATRTGTAAATGYGALGAELGEQAEQVVDVDGAVVRDIRGGIRTAEGGEHVQDILRQ